MLHSILTWLYWTIHRIVPQSALSWIGIRLPYRDDHYVPAGFFVPPPKSLPISTHFHSPLPDLSKLILVRDVIINGVVVAVEPFQPHPSWNHQTFYIRPTDMGLLNQFSGLMVLSWPGTMSTLKCEPEPDMQNLPAVGDVVAVWGHFVIDLAHGWTSIVPVSHWTKIG